jgi:hypothetical protein
VANFRILEAVRNSMLDTLNTALNAGTGPAEIRIYSGSQPANANTALSGNTLLATLVLSDPAAPAAASGVLTIDVTPVPEDTSADATGTASFARVVDSAGTVVFDCDVTATGGGGTIELNTVSIVAGGPVRITSFTITIPAA